MALAFVSAHNNVALNAATVAVTFTPIAGNFLVALVHIFNNGGGFATVSITVTDGNGNSWTKDFQNSYQSLGNDSVWRVNSCNGGSTTITVTCSGTGVPASNFPSITVLEYSGVNVASPELDKTNFAQSAGSTAFDSGNITTTASNEIVVGFFNIVSGTGNETSTADPSWNTRFGGGANSTNVEADMLVASIGTYHFFGTINQSLQWGATIVSYKSLSILNDTHSIDVALKNIKFGPNQINRGIN